jgi:hypothetical protein
LKFAGQNLGVASTTGSYTNEKFISNTVNSWWDENKNANANDINKYPTTSSSGQ